ncbi:prepilin-type N-terminal cleavage/methylation domain-containing protein [Candidatus Wolfebacteria bacterium]|nr:prepilin-type N-terminal cleavage/methylation domain-containing protein [Candidatus Wolfebacteria bacterium]
MPPELNAQRSTLNALSGFTLIELLITIGVLTAVAAVGILTFSGFRVKQDIENTATSIAAILREAQTRSIGQEDGMVWGVHFINASSSGRTYALFRGTTIPPVAGDIVAKYSLPQTIAFIAPGEGASISVQFSAVTGLPGSSSTIHISAASGGETEGIISVEANGVIKSVIN